MEPLVVQGETAGYLPADPVLEGTGRIAVGQALKGLEHHHGGHYVGRHRRTAPTRREQVGEQLVGEELLPVIGEEALDAALRDEPTAKGSRIQQFTVGIAVSLHAPSL